MKLPIIYEKRVKTVGDVIEELQKLDPKAKVEAESFPHRNKPLLSIWRCEDTRKISIRLGS